MRLPLTLPALAVCLLACTSQAQEVEPLPLCASQPLDSPAACREGGPLVPDSTRETAVISAKRAVSQRQAELDKAMRKGDPARIDQGREQLAGARKALQQAVEQLDK